MGGNEQKEASRERKIKILKSRIFFALFSALFWGKRAEKRERHDDDRKRVLPHKHTHVIKTHISINKNGLHLIRFGFDPAQQSCRQNDVVREKTVRLRQGKLRTEICFRFFFSRVSLSLENVLLSPEGRGGKFVLKEREREKRGRETDGAVKKTDASFLFSDDAFQSRLKKKKKRKRERERCKISSALHWLEKDRSLSLLLIFAPSFLPCFLLLRAFCLSHCCGEEREREKESTFVWVVSNGDDEIVVVVFLIFKGLLFSRKRWFWGCLSAEEERKREREGGGEIREKSFPRTREKNRIFFLKDLNL